MSDVFGISLRMWLGILFTAAVVLLTVLVYLVSIIARRGYASGSRSSRFRSPSVRSA